MSACSETGAAVIGGLSAAARAGSPPDPESYAWLERLRSSGPGRDAALRELHALLLGAARYALLRRAAQLDREGLDDLAVQAADDALLAVLAHLDDYRGESRFTTWAWKFAFYEACAARRKRRWLDREIPDEAAGWDLAGRELGPHARAEQRELLDALRTGVEEALTAHQRRIFVALALNQVPVDVLAERLGTTRGALYKTLHDARERLRSHLAGLGLAGEAQQRSPRRLTDRS